MKFKTIDIGAMILLRVKELGIENDRICNFFNLTIEDIEAMFLQKSLDTELLLKWSKLLEYDFFRIYSQHLIFYAPPSSTQKQAAKTELPTFRKNIYTKEVIDFIIELVETRAKTKQQIIDEYNIPKTTLYKWLHKNSK